MKQFNFLDWPVYKDAQELVSFSLEIVRKLPKEHRFELSSQLIRSSSSVVLNIAEGSGKSSRRDFSHFIDIALGSLYETVANMDILKTNQLINNTDFELAKEKAASIARQLGGFRKKLKT
ncbi:MAG: four helix bundle protein [bacterium]|nr:four helix bundle protein [bacterium]